MYVKESLHEQSLNLCCFIVILKVGSKPIDLILSGMSFHVLQVENNNGLVYRSAVKDFRILIS